MADTNKHTIVGRILRGLAWSVGVAVTLVVVVVAAVMVMLTPDRLTPLTARIANHLLDADVTVSRVDLSLRGSYPFCDISIDSLTIRSKQILALPPAIRDSLPQWGDTLFTVSNIRGGIDILTLVAGSVHLSDVQFVEPRTNILIVNDSVNNFSIVRLPSHSATRDSVPDIRIHRFRLVDPQPIRFSNIVDQMSLNLVVASAQLTSDSQAQTPTYTVNFDSDIVSPVFQVIGQDVVNVGFDGDVLWQHDKPYDLQIRDFDFKLFKVAGRLNASFNFLDRLMLQSVDFELQPIAVNELLTIAHDSPLIQRKLPRNIDTDAAIGLSGRLLQPYVVGSSTLPYATIDVDVAPCHIYYDKLAVDTLALRSVVKVNGGWIDDIVVDVHDLYASGPAISVKATGTVSRMQHDPLIVADVDAHADAAQLPAFVTRTLSATWRGRADLDAHVVCRPSMFSAEGWHRLQIDGQLDVRDFYYLRDDTLMMYSVPRLTATFGEKSNVRCRTVTNGSDTIGLLRASVSVGTAQALISGLQIGLDGLRLSAGTSDSTATALAPVDGTLSARRFSLFAISDTLGVETQGLSGTVAMQRRRGYTQPLMSVALNLGFDSIVSGMPTARLLLGDASLCCNIDQLPVRQFVPEQVVHRRVVHPIHPELAPGDVYRAAMVIRSHQHPPGYHRVHPVEAPDGGIAIDWNPSNMIRNLLFNYRVGGTMTAVRAGVLLDILPLDTTIGNFDVRFDNDSIRFDDLSVHLGNSTVGVSGVVSNLRDGLTSVSAEQPLRVQLSMGCDYMDVNQVTDALFARDKFATRSVQRDSAGHRRDIQPVILPTNIDLGLRLRADRSVYSDITLSNLTATLAVHDATVCIDELRACSDVGSLDMSATYVGREPDSLRLDFDMDVSRFNIRHFLTLAPPVDSVMPLMRNLGGIVSAQLAASARLDTAMRIKLPTLRADISIQGDSIKFLDEQTYRKVSHWLMFRHKDGNLINHLDVDMTIADGMLRVQPFVFDFNRYRLGIEGSNDLDLNFNYHVAVLRSPIPFRFGINITGRYDDLRVRFGGADWTTSP